MITVKPTEEQKQKAIAFSKAQGNIKNSIMQGSRTAVGYLGEIIVSEVLKATPQGCKDFDLLSKDGTKLECKTFSTNYRPKETFECNVMSTSNHQQCDVYVFSGYNKNKSELYICGYLSREDFYNKATRVKKGDISKANGLKYRADGYVLTVGELNPIEDLL